MLITSLNRNCYEGVIMNILVVGANGRVGSHLVNTLAKMGHTVYAGARKESLNFTNANIHYFELNLLADLKEIIQRIMSVNLDAMYFTAGSRGKNLLQVDAFGAVKVMQAAQAVGIRRFIMLSSVFALQPERWNEEFLQNITDYNIAKFFADHWLVHQSNLDFTILQPGALQENLGTGRIQINVTEPLSNSIDNVVDTLSRILSAPNTIGRVITMADGDIPITEALN
ncbi:putative sugar epimerase YhfK [compost metagenome]